MAATSSGLTVNKPAKKWLTENDAETIFNRLEEHGKTWKIYVAEPMQFSATAIIHYQRLKDRLATHFVPFAQFEADADNGTLPSFSIVDPDFDAYSEENPQDIRKGESFAAEVISRVMHGAGWPRTLLIWVYDEHGGYYDHVSPPPAPPPDDVVGSSLIGTQTRLQALLAPLLPGVVQNKEKLTEGPHHYDRYGFRVPAVIVSPYARPDYVCSEVLDHTSVLKLVQEKWNLPALTARDAAATSPLAALDLDGPPAFLTPPELPAPALRWGTW